MSTGWGLEYSRVKSRLDFYDVIKIIYYFWTELDASSSGISNMRPYANTYVRNMALRDSELLYIYINSPSGFQNITKI